MRQITAGMKRVAMQYSPMCAIPYVAMVDAGTVELVRSLGLEVVSSAELIQVFEARWTPEALESHLEAGRRVDKVRAEAFALIRERTRNGAPLQEVEVKHLVREGFRRGGPGDRSRPHRGVQRQRLQSALRADRGVRPRRFTPGDWVLLDMWAKLDQPGAVYYDITWTGVLRRSAAGERCARCSRVVTGARDAAIQRVTDAVAAGLAAARVRSGRCLPRGDCERPGTANISRIARAIRLAWKCTATAPTWTTWRPTTSGG